MNFKNDRDRRNLTIGKRSVLGNKKRQWNSLVLKRKFMSIALYTQSPQSEVGEPIVELED